jgi:hypothetical protein
MCREDLHRRQIGRNVIPRPSVPRPGQDIVRCPILAALRYRLSQEEAGGISAVLHWAQERIEYALCLTDKYLHARQKDVVDAGVGNQPRTRDKSGNFREFCLVDAHDEPPQRTWERNSS